MAPGRAPRRPASRNRGTPPTNGHSNTLSERGIGCLDAEMGGTAGTRRWYESGIGFEWIKSYLHVYVQGRAEVEAAVQSSIPDLKPVQILAHYAGNERESVRTRFERVHDCNCFRLSF